MYWFLCCGIYVFVIRLVNKCLFNIFFDLVLLCEYICFCFWEVEYFYILVERVKLGMVEIGCYYGGSIFMLVYVNWIVLIYSVDIVLLNDDLVCKYFFDYKIGGNVDFIIGDF